VMALGAIQLPPKRRRPWSKHGSASLTLTGATPSPPGCKKNLQAVLLNLIIMRSRE